MGALGEGARTKKHGAGTAGAADDCSSGPARSGLQCAKGGPGQSAVAEVANLDHGVPVVPGDGGEAPGGVVDLTLDLYVAKKRQNYEAVPETPLQQPTGGPAPSGTSRYISTRLRWEPVNIVPIDRLPVRVDVGVNQSQVSARPDWRGGQLTVGPRGPLMGTEHLV